MNKKHIYSIIFILFLVQTFILHTMAIAQEQDDYLENTEENINKNYDNHQTADNATDSDENYINLDQEPTNEINSIEFIENNALTTQQEEENIKKIHMDIIQNLNSHNKEGLFQFYDSKYKNSDNITKEELKSLMDDLWQNFPDIHYDSRILNIRVTDKLAVLETYDTVQGTTANSSLITQDHGQLSTKLHNFTYFKKLSNMWKIVGDYSIYEESTLKYGVSKEIDIQLVVPEVVFNGDSYAAKLLITKPFGVNAVASITKEPIAYPRKSPEDLFRSIAADTNKLERIFKANMKNYNELCTATVGFTEVTEDNNANPLIVLKGIATVSKRTNVLPLIHQGNETK